MENLTIVLLFQIKPSPRLLNPSTTALPISTKPLPILTRVSGGKNYKVAYNKVYKDSCKFVDMAKFATSIVFHTREDGINFKYARTVTNSGSVNAICLHKFNGTADCKAKLSIGVNDEEMVKTMPGQPARRSDLRDNSRFMLVNTLKLFDIKNWRVNENGPLMKKAHSCIHQPEIEKLPVLPVELPVLVKVTPAENYNLTLQRMKGSQVIFHTREGTEEFTYKSKNTRMNCGVTKYAVNTGCTNRQCAATLKLAVKIPGMLSTEGQDNVFGSHLSLLSSDKLFDVANWCVLKNSSIQCSKRHTCRSVPVTVKGPIHNSKYRLKNDEILPVVTGVVTGHPVEEPVDLLDVDDEPEVVTVESEVMILFFNDYSHISVESTALALFHFLSCEG